MKLIKQYKNWLLRLLTNTYCLIVQWSIPVDSPHRSELFARSRDIFKRNNNVLPSAYKATAYKECMYMRIDLKNRISHLIRPVYSMIEQSHLENIYLLRSEHKVVLPRFSFGQDCIHTHIRYNRIDCWTILCTKSTESLGINVELNLITTFLVDLFLYFYVSCIRVIFGDIFLEHMQRYRKRNLQRDLVEFSGKVSIDAAPSGRRLYPRDKFRYCYCFLDSLYITVTSVANIPWSFKPIIANKL